MPARSRGHCEKRKFTDFEKDLWNIVFNKELFSDDGELEPILVKLCSKAILNKEKAVL